MILLRDGLVFWRRIVAWWFHARHWRPFKDNCEICHGKNGGMPGNENVSRSGIVYCDFCDVNDPGAQLSEADLLERLLKQLGDKSFEEGGRAGPDDIALRKGEVLAFMKPGAYRLPTMEEFHGLLLKMIDVRMDALVGTVEADELYKLAQACVIIEREPMNDQGDRQQ